MNGTAPGAAGREPSADHFRFDAVDESRRRWRRRGLPGAESMAAAVSLMYAAGLVRASLDESLRPFGLTYPRYEVLGVLSFSRDGRLAMGKIASRWRVHPATLTSTVDRLEALGLVTRVPGDEDRRSVVAELTPAGAELFDVATQAITKKNFGLAGLTRTQQREITALLRQLRAVYDGFE